MSCNFVRLFASTILSLLAFCAAASAQDTYNYHIIDQFPLPSNTPFNEYYQYLMRDPAKPDNPIGLYNAHPSIGDYVYDVKVILYNDDSTLVNGLYIHDGRMPVTIQSNISGQVRSLKANGVPLFHVGYFSDLIITSDIRIYDNTNTSSSSYSAIELLGYSSLTANNVKFARNSNTGTDYFGIGGGAISARRYYYNDGYNFLELNGAEFELNSSEGGGAIGMSQSYMLADKAKFTSNKATAGNGGALYMNYGSYAQITRSEFRNNSATSTAANKGHGGAIFSQNSDLYLKGTSFTGNTATGSGGAIFFDTTSGTYNITLGADENTTVDYSNNKEFYGSSKQRANSIVFANTSDWVYYDYYGYLYNTEAPVTKGNITVNVEVEKNGVLNMDDPMSVFAPTTSTAEETALQVMINKTGSGIWNLSGTNDFSRATGSAQFNIFAGTFQLMNGTQILLDNIAQDGAIDVYRGATLIAGNSKTPANAVRIETNLFRTQAGSSLVLNNDFTLDLSGTDSVIYGSISGNGDLIKDGNGVLTYSGSSAGYGGNLEIEAGTFRIDSEKSFVTTGDVRFADNTIFTVTANSYQPNIVADNITIGNNVQFTVTGIFGTSDRYIVLKSDNAITGEFDATSPVPINVDYLNYDFEFNESKTEYAGNVTLTWDKDNASDANGTFTIDWDTGWSDYFKVGVVLEDEVGKKLTKAGRGTLELAMENKYTGGTDVNEGTLKVTNAKGTGDGAVVLQNGTTLNLEFDAGYDNRITGSGKVLKTGKGTVTLNNTSNNYSGGTEIQDGTISIANRSALGTGTVTFGGGTLQNTSVMTLTMQMHGDGNNDVKIDTQADLVLAGVVDGAGGLYKTGNAKLTLQGPGSYKGDTTVAGGTLAVGEMVSLGDGKLVFHDGTGFQNYGALNNDRNIVLYTENESSAKQNLSGVTFNTQADLIQTGLVSGGGKLIKTGASTLVLENENTFSGGMQLNDGVVEFSHTKNLGSGSIEFNGGTLRNTEKIDDFNLSMTTSGASKNAKFETLKDMTVSSRIVGTGGLEKRGDATLTLTGDSSYYGNTVVQAGLLKVDGSIQSKTYVETGAALAGSGTIYNDVYFRSDSSYEWHYGYREEDSPYLNVSGNVHLNNATFTPVTAGSWDSYPETVDGWTVLRYTGTLQGDGKFATINNERSPFYDFELDYSNPNRITAIGTSRKTPRALSDSVAMGLVMPQRRVYRQVFDRIDQDLQRGRELGLQPVRFDRLRGQAPMSARNLWGVMYGRTTKFESSYHDDRWKLNSFGLQVGYSLYSTNWFTLGITGGLDLPEMKSSGDKMELTDGFFGIYYGQRIYGMWELKGYLGGGAQRYRSYRNDTRYTYRTNYYGDTFEMNWELARPFLIGSYIFRPHVAFDLEYAGQQASKEEAISSEYRTYSGASLTQFYFRVGFDLRRQWDRGDTFFGMTYANMIGGQATPKVNVYYPTVKMGTTSYGTNLGHNVITLRGGCNYNLDHGKNKTLFLNIVGDIYADRAGGQGEIGVTGGYNYRF